MSPQKTVRGRDAEGRHEVATVLGAVVIAVATGLGCGATLPTPETRPQPSGAYVDVPFPPPPARPEELTGQPAPGTVWVDGEWRWRGQWTWVFGRWVHPPEGASMARWNTRRTASGQLQHAPSRWYGPDGEPLPPPDAVKLAEAGEGDRVEDVGIMVDVGRNRQADELVEGNEGEAPSTQTRDCKFDCKIVEDDLSERAEPAPSR